MRIGNNKNPGRAFCRTPLQGMQVQILSLTPLIFPRSYQCALTFQDHRLVYLARLIRLSFDDSRGKHHNIPLRPLPLLSSHPRISLPARRPFQDHGTVPELLQSGRRLSRELQIRLEEILALTGTLSNEQPITIREAVIQMVTMTEVCVGKSCDRAAHVWLASA